MTFALTLVDTNAAPRQAFYRVESLLRIAVPSLSRGRIYRQFWLDPTVCIVTKESLAKIHPKKTPPRLS
jgi:hypothetical protein